MRYGRVEDYRPEPAGAIGADRLEAFLKARDMAAPVRRKLEVSFEQLTGDRKSLAAIKRGLGVVPLIAEYFVTRSEIASRRRHGNGRVLLYLYRRLCLLAEKAPGRRTRRSFDRGRRLPHGVGRGGQEGSPEELSPSGVSGS